MGAYVCFDVDVPFHSDDVSSAEVNLRVRDVCIDGKILLAFDRSVEYVILDDYVSVSYKGVELDEACTFEIYNPDTGESLTFLDGKVQILAVLDGWGLQGDNVRVRVKVDLSGIDLRSEAIQNHIMNTLWRERDFTDFYIAAAGGVEIKCHRAVLAAASPVFKSMLMGDMQEGLQQFASIDEPADTLEALIEFMYIGTVPVDMDYRIILGLIEFSDFYNLPELFKICEPRLLPLVSEGNILHMLRRLHVLKNAGPTFESLFRDLTERVRDDDQLFNIVCANVALPAEDDSNACHLAAQNPNLFSYDGRTQIADFAHDAERQLVDELNDSAAGGTALLSSGEADEISLPDTNLGTQDPDAHDTSGRNSKQKHETSGAAVDEAHTAEGSVLPSCHVDVGASTSVPCAASSFLVEPARSPGGSQPSDAVVEDMCSPGAQGRRSGPRRRTRRGKNARPAPADAPGPADAPADALADAPDLTSIPDTYNTWE